MSKSRFIPLIAAASLTLVLAGPVSADPNEVVRPGCGNIISGGAEFSSTTDTFRVFTEARCGGVVYTLYVFDSPGDTTADVFTTRGTATFQDEFGNVFHFAEFTFADADDTICVVAESSLGGRILDRAPDSGPCTEFTASAGGAGQFN
jgi:hypothetical protein